MLERIKNWITVETTTPTTRTVYSTSGGNSSMGDIVLSVARLIGRSRANLLFLGEFEHFLLEFYRGFNLDSGSLCTCSIVTG